MEMNGVHITGGLQSLPQQGAGAAAPGQVNQPKAEGRKLKAGWVVTFVLLTAMIGFLGWGLYKSSSGPRASGAAPDFTIQSYTTGQNVTLSQLRGQVVIVNFWASWCPPCREEAAYLEKTWRKYEGKGVTFLGVDWVDTPVNAQAYLKEFDITYPNGPDLGTKAAQVYRIQGVPETYYVDRKGNLRGVHIGPLKDPELDQKIDELLAEKP
jgi:cytochrome c biogenesis protein CcmG/thiol:disulfide interchange protein DsbE